MIEGIILENDIYMLREFKVDDLNDFYEYAKEEGVGEAAGWPHHTSIEITKNVLDNFIKGKNVFAIYHKLDKKVIGSVGLHSDYNQEVFKKYVNNKIIEIGYVLSSAYWGKGIMPTILHILIDYLFKNMNYDYITAAYFLENQQSKRVQEKVGFMEYKIDKYYSSLLNKNFESMYTILKNKYR